eukprot:2665720-Prymnesium_polylepis.1
MTRKGREQSRGLAGPFPPMAIQLYLSEPYCTICTAVRAQDPTWGTHIYVPRTVRLPYNVFTPTTAIGDVFRGAAVLSTSVCAPYPWACAMRKHLPSNLGPAADRLPWTGVGALAPAAGAAWNDHDAPAAPCDSA